MRPGRDEVPLTAELAIGLLSAAGIPSVFQGGSHYSAKGYCEPPGDLYVPRLEHVRARAVLVEAWGEDEVGKFELDARAPLMSRGLRRRYRVAIAVLLLVSAVYAVLIFAQP